MTLGQNILRLRGKAGLSQLELAEKLSVSRQSVSKWETDAAVPDLDRLVAMAQLFSVSLDELVNGEPAASPAQPAPADGASQTAADFGGVSGSAAPVWGERAPNGAAPGAGAFAADGAPAQPRRYPARKVGLILLLTAAVIAVVLLPFVGLASIILALPFLLVGLACCFAKQHPILASVWALFLPCFFLGSYTGMVMPLLNAWTLSQLVSLHPAMLPAAAAALAVQLLLVAATAFSFGKTLSVKNRKRAAILGGCALALRLLLPLSLRALLSQSSTQLIWLVSFLSAVSSALMPILLSLFGAALVSLLLEKKRQKSA